MLPPSRIAAFMAVIVLGLVGTFAAPAAAEALSDKDVRLYHKAFIAVRANKWRHAESLAAKAKDPLLAKAIGWLDLSQTRSRAGFEARAKFLKDNPHWPGRSFLRRLAEESLEDRTPDATVLKWFMQEAPVTGHGMIRYGEALLRAGNTVKGTAVIRKGWVKGNFGLREERTVLARHRKMLRPQDHIARLDRLLWEGRRYPARRMMRRVDKEHRALAEARLRLRRMEGGVDWAIRQVPKALRRDPGLLYERLRWRRRRGLSASAREILFHPPANLVRPDMWWTERSIIARRALDDGDISAAYRLARDHGTDSGVAFVEGEWLAGWIALRFLQDREVALHHFIRLHDAAKYPISKARGAYWAGRAAEALNRPSLAEDWYRRAARFTTTYHGQLAAAKLEDGPGFALPPGPRPSAAESAAFEKLELVKVVRQLGQIGETQRIKPFLLRLQALARTPSGHALVGTLALAEGRPDLAVRVAKRSVRAGVTLVAQGYPIPFELQGDDPEPALVLAVMRQESAFDALAQSGAGARGLMQLLPTTARTIARRMRVKYSRKKLKSDPSYNLILGRAYLANLLTRYDGSYVLALAAYNAGPARVRRWLRERGDPRQHDVDAIDWIETIPFEETRAYVQRVLENLQVYRARLGTTTVALSLENDLHFRR